MPNVYILPKFEKPVQKHITKVNQRASTPKKHVKNNVSTKMALHLLGGSRGIVFFWGFQEMQITRCGIFKTKESRQRHRPKNNAS